MKKISLLLGSFILLGLVALLGYSFTIVKEGQCGIVSSAHEQTVLEPGLHFLWPWQSLEFVSVNDQISYFEVALPQSNEEVQLGVVWQIQDINAYLKANESPDEILNLLKAQTTTLLTPGLLSTTTSPVNLGNSILQALQADIVIQQKGIVITQVWIKGIVPNDAAQAKIFANMKGLAAIIADSIVQNGQAEAEQIRNQAEQGFLQAQSAALANAAEILGQGNSAAVKMMAPLYRENPELFKSYVAAKVKLLLGQSQS